MCNIIYIYMLYNGELFPERLAIFLYWFLLHFLIDTDHHKAIFHKYCCFTKHGGGGYYNKFDSTESLEVYYWYAKIPQCRYMEHGLKMLAFMFKNVRPNKQSVITLASSRHAVRGARNLWLVYWHTSWIASPVETELRAVPDSKVRGANMGPIWGRQDPGGPHVGPMNFAIWGCILSSLY